MNEPSIRKKAQEFSALRERFGELWRRYEKRLPGNVMSYRPYLGESGCLTNLTPEQYEKCLRVLSGEG